MEDILGSVPSSELLVVDTDPLTETLCRETAGLLGLGVRTARETETVVDYLESGQINVLVLSREFPDPEHLEFVRHLRYWYPETQVVIVADEPSFPDAVESIKLGAFDYLPKPLERDVLRLTIERAMAQSRIEAGQRVLTRSP